MTELENDLLWNSYFYPSTDVLINNYDIRDKEELKKVKTNNSFEKLLELFDNPIILDNFVSSLKELHYYIFNEIYPFACQYIKVNMRKRIGTFLFINNDKDIERYLSELFKEIDSLLDMCKS